MFNGGARGEPKETMKTQTKNGSLTKAYTFNVAPVIAAMLPGYDCTKIGNAVEAHGNDNLTVVDTSDKSANGYKAEKTSASGKTTEASSTATVTKRVKLEGDGSPHRMFAGWHDDTVKMVSKYGKLGACPLPVVLKTWLDAKFKVTAKPASNGTMAAPARVTTPTVAPATNGETVAPATK